MATMKKMMEDTKERYIAQIMAMLTGTGEDVAKCATGEMNLPVVLEDGTEAFVVVKVSMPTGSRDGVAYDGYEAREEYTKHCQEMERKAKEKAEAKAKKMAKDAENRKKLAESKAKANAGKESK